MLNEVIARFATGTYTVTRTTRSTNLLGRTIPGTSTTFTMSASIQPMTGNAIKGGNDVTEAEDIRIVYTRTALNTLTATHAPDVITIGAESFKVFKVESFSAISGGHYRAHIARQLTP